MKISSLQQAISNQAEIVRFLADQGIKDLVGDYGELLTQQALGGVRMNAVNQGYDIQHPEYRRIEVKTRKWELQKDGSVRKEDRAVGFKGKEEQLEWLAHIILGTDFKVEHACLVSYADVWPEILRTTNKVSFKISSNLPSSRDLTLQIQKAQNAMGFGI